MNAIAHLFFIVTSAWAQAGDSRQAVVECVGENTIGGMSSKTVITFFAPDVFFSREPDNQSNQRSVWTATTVSFLTEGTKEVQATTLSVKPTLPVVVTTMGARSNITIPKTSLNTFSMQMGTLVEQTFAGRARWDFSAENLGFLDLTYRFGNTTKQASIRFRCTDMVN